MNALTPLQEALAPRSDQLNADDLIPGPRTLRITEARIIDAGREGKKVVVRYEGDNGKPWKPCKTMGRAMVIVWGITDETQFAGKSVTVYRDPNVDFGAEKGIGGIRISHMSHIDGPKSVKLTVSQGKKAQFVFKPITAEVREMRAAKPIKADTAEDWAKQYAAGIRSAADASALETFAAINAEWAGKLPDSLRVDCIAVLDQRRSDFAEIEREGKPADQQGEGFTDADDVGF